MPLGSINPKVAHSGCGWGHKFKREKTKTMYQYVIVAFVLLLSVAYLGYRAYHALKVSDDPCSGCSGCALKEMKGKVELSKKAKRECAEKKREKKFAQTK